MTFIPCLPGAQALGSRDSVNFTAIVVFNKTFTSLGHVQLINDVVGVRGLS